jgi:hypothetical protein
MTPTTSVPPAVAAKLSRVAESIMLVLISIIVVIGFTFLVILGALRLVTDLVAMSAHRQPSLPDEPPDAVGAPAGIAAATHNHAAQ